MKKKVSVLLVFVMLVAMLGGCQLLCKHNFAEATCDAPQTCTECGKTKGEALGHDWQAATCEEPEHCSRCDMKRGDPVDHQWVDATCDTAKTCSACGAVDGEPLGHTWEEATTEEPQYCTVCQITEGEPLDTDPRFTTASTKELQGKWAAYIEMTGDVIGLPDFESSARMAMYAEFSNVGELRITAGIDDEETFSADLIEYIVDMTYAELAASGLNEEAAEEAILSSTGMTMEEYAAYTVEMLNMNDIFGAIETTMCYYVEHGRLYSAISWGAEFTDEAYEIKDGVLTMENTYLEDPEAPLEWTRVEE